MERKKVQDLNMEILLRVVILLGFAGFFTMVLLNGTVTLYVHPRIVPYMVFGIVAMAVIALASLKDLFRPAQGCRVMPYTLFIIPLFLAFAVPAKAMDSNSMSFDKAGIALQAPDGAAAEGVATSQSPAQSAAIATAVTANPVPKSDPVAEGPISMTDSTFVPVMNDIYSRLNQYEGKEIHATGFVFKDTKQFNKNEFVAARLMMTCCTADLQPVGLLCRYDGAANLAADAWVTVTGTISIFDFKGDKMPCILVESVSKAEKPKDEYVYPY